MSEDFVKVFQAATRRLRVEEPSDGDESCVHACPNNVEPIAQILDSPWSDVDHNEVAKPVRTDTNGDTLVARTQWHNFRCVHPRDGKNAPREDVEEDETECYKDPLCR